MCRLESPPSLGPAMPHPDFPGKIPPANSRSQKVLSPFKIIVIRGPWIKAAFYMGIAIGPIPVPGWDEIRSYGRISAISVFM